MRHLQRSNNHIMTNYKKCAQGIPRLRKKVDKIGLLLGWYDVALGCDLDLVGFQIDKWDLVDYPKFGLNAAANGAIALTMSVRYSRVSSAELRLWTFSSSFSDGSSPTHRNLP